MQPEVRKFTRKDQVIVAVITIGLVALIYFGFEVLPSLENADMIYGFAAEFILYFVMPVTIFLGIATVVLKRKPKQKE